MSHGWEEQPRSWDGLGPPCTMPCKNLEKTEIWKDCRGLAPQSVVGELAQS